MSDNSNAAEPGASASTTTSAVSSPSVTADASQAINHDTATSTSTPTTTTTTEHTNGNTNHNHTPTDSITSKTVDGNAHTPATSSTMDSTTTSATPTATSTPGASSSSSSAAAAVAAPSISTSTASFTSSSPSPSTPISPFSTFPSTPIPSPGIPSRNLYVNHIPPISEPAFTQLFAAHGPIERIRLFPAAGTMGYGFVMYARVEDAQKAVNAMNGFIIGGHPIHVSYKTESKKPPPPAALPVMNSTSTNVYLANIPLHWTKIELDECCSVFGRIMESRVMMNLSTNTSRGIAFVRYEKVTEAALCIKSLHGVTLSGATPVIAKIADDKLSPRQPQVLSRTPTPYTKPVTTSSYGPIKTTTSTYRYNPMQSTTTTPYQSYSTPSYTPAAAQSSVPAYQPYTTPASQAYSPYTTHTPTPPQPPAQPTTPYVSPYQTYTTPSAPVRTNPVPPPTPPSLVAAAAAAATASGEEGFALFVFHLPPNVTETELTQLFSPYGKLTKVSIIRDLSSGTSKGYGFVNMAKKEEAEQAVLYLDGFALGSKHISVSFKK